MLFLSLVCSRHLHHVWWVEVSVPKPDCRRRITQICPQGPKPATQLFLSPTTELSGKQVLTCPGAEGRTGLLSPGGLGTNWWGRKGSRCLLGLEVWVTQAETVDWTEPNKPKHTNTRTHAHAQHTRAFRRNPRRSPGQQTDDVHLNTF